VSLSVYFITHPEVVIDPAVPVPRWPLSGRGRERMSALTSAEWAGGLRAIYASEETKAVEAARILADPIGVTPVLVADLGENDRSATGFLPGAEFEATADAFFASPDRSVRGWETARSAQRRIRRAVDALMTGETEPGSIAIVSHGAVGTLLLCDLAGWPIARERDQPGAGGGNWFRFAREGGAEAPELVHGWRSIEDALGPAAG